MIIIMIIIVIILNFCSAYMAVYVFFSIVTQACRLGFNFTQTKAMRIHHQSVEPVHLRQHNHKHLHRAYTVSNVQWGVRCLTKKCLQLIKCNLLFVTLRDFIRNPFLGQLSKSCLYKVRDEFSKVRT